MSAPQPRNRSRPHPAESRWHRVPSEIPDLPPALASKLDKVAERFAFRANDYYLGLIDWDDPADPIRRLVVPSLEELNDWGRLDASNEAANTVVPGVQHKYRDTALVLAAATCASYCRFCFRKRLFLRQNEEIPRDLSPAFRYIARHREITDVLLTGGDPLVLETAVLRPILRRFAAMPHVLTIRIGSKTPAFNPFRILDDEDLLECLDEIVATGTAVYLMAHFDHPRELTDEARDAIQLVQEVGAHVVNQCPLVRGVNDDPDVLAELFETMTELGAPQYYLFQGRPTMGNRPFMVPLVEGWRIFDTARRRCSGLSRRSRYAMSHASGKLEMVGLDDERIYLRYHRARDPRQESRVVICARDDRACWFDDLAVIA